jgi:hypothetical protein
VSDGEPSDEENDLLDLACVNTPLFRCLDASYLHLRYGLTQTSRLGCQVKLTPGMNGMQVASPLRMSQFLPVMPVRLMISSLINHQCKLPEATRNFYVDGHKPKPH